MLSWIISDSDFLYFSQLGLQLSGPIWGVFPLSRLGYFQYRLSGGLPYNYTLMNQGLTSNINCEYAPQSLINVFGITDDATNLLMQYNGTCDGVGETNVLPDNTQFVALNSTNTLMFWACKFPPNETELSYFIYLGGLQNYATGIGNITCTICICNTTGTIPCDVSVHLRYFFRRGPKWSRCNHILWIPQWICGDVR